MARYGMVIDLHKCTGCGACALACKTENNTQDYSNGKFYNWANYLTFTTGKFPSTKVVTIPTLCNHCSDAPCVEACPVNPKAMYKSPEGITLHNNDRCIGCQRCITACPYSDKDINAAGVQYSVINYLPSDDYTHKLWRDKTELIPGCTASGDEVAKKAGSIPPNMNEFSDPDYQPVRRNDIVEKCMLCRH
ncbi:MAG: 4Fe-4S dicluster domain-containing protein, partial [Candidatus Kapaibacteriota bacterium]